LFGYIANNNNNNNNNDDDDDDDDDDDNNNNNNNKVTILWNQQVQTDRTIPSNKPDIVIRNNEKGTCILIDVAIPSDRNVIQKEAEKILKYKDLTIEVQRTWNVKTRVIPVITGVTGTISKSFSAPYQETMKLRNYRKLPYWALHTYFGKC
jgi:hypothetical protein